MWTYLLIAIIILLLIDWYQTIRISAQPDLFYETNLILGNHPSRREVHLYFTGTIALTIFLAFTLPEQYTMAGICFGIIIELWCVINNYRLGIR